jgi:hypothetical protein
MRTVKLKQYSAHPGDNHTLMRSYKNVVFSNSCVDVQDFAVFTENRQKLLANVETIDVGSINRVDMNRIMHLCGNLKEIKLRGIYKYDPEWTFEHPLPIKISMFYPLKEFLDRFKVITNISGLVMYDTLPSEEFMAKYGAMINSFAIHLHGPLDAWCRFGNLKLQSVCFLQYKNCKLDGNTVQAFFEKQAPFLKSIEFMRMTDVFWFDPMRMLLKNLETVKIKFCLAGLRLNDLKVLPKLKCLELKEMFNNVQEYYHLDVVELIELTELSISNSSVASHNVPKLRFATRTLSMNAMEKLEIFHFRLDFETLEQIAQTMPNLKVLDFNILVRKRRSGKR